ncbi:hypothetical protein DYB35_012453 [Aphanomyces astaci]|uniref:DDE-1 domain-containing protein n=1 Tax=Aphanomyces astaci TaxID=112090 RepID=A0A3R7ADN3_APHAT|nr:hypothetical protein DYB34_011913 [Aphanomyces astaci]RHZ00321.1 hypothetical protein DYB35_012453 [Aphanomyces astaci]
MHYFTALIKATLGFSCTVADVYNMDETSFKTKSQNKKVVAIRGSKNAWYEEIPPPYHLTIVVVATSDGTLPLNVAIFRTFKRDIKTAMTT